jgi:hypothetical protein
VLAGIEWPGATGKLDARPDRRHGMLGAAWQNDQMGMIGHQYISPQRKVMLLTSILNGLSQPLASSFGLEKGETPVARERQLIRMSRHIHLSATTLAILSAHANIGVSSSAKSKQFLQARLHCRMDGCVWQEGWLCLAQRGIQSRRG